MNEDVSKIRTQPVADIPLAARLFGVSEGSIRRAIKDGSLPAFKVAGQWRLPTAPLREKLGITQHGEAA